MKNRLKSTLKTFNNGERGAAFPIVLIMLLLAGLMVPPLMSLVSTSLVAGKTYEDNSNELYAADAGVMDATWLLQSTEDISDLLDEDGIYTYTMLGQVNGYTVSIEIKDDVNSYIITSTATGVDGSTTIVETRVQDPPPAPTIWVAAGALDGDLKISADVGEADAWVNIYANGDISMIGGAQVFGDAYYTTGHSIIQFPPSGWFWGTGIETPKLRLKQEILPEKPVTEITGNHTINSSQDFGNVYVTGDLSIGAQAQVTLTGTVWVDGKITVGAGSGIHAVDNDGEYYFIISEYAGNEAIKVVGNIPGDWEYKIVEAVCYAPNGSIYVGGTAGIDGAVIGKSVDIQGDSKLTFPLPFEPIPPDYNRMETTYWKIT